MKKWMVAAGMLILLAAGLLGWYYLATRDKREIRNLIENAAGLVHKKSGDVPHAGVFKFTKVDELFCPYVELRISQPAVSARWSRDNLKANVAIMQRMIDEMSVKVSGVEVELIDGAAIFDFDADVSGGAKKGNIGFADVYRCSGSAEKNEGKWKISSITAEPVIKK